ncbi:MULTISPECIES: LLM class flavin-dependent oxidoreductase [unclassified Haladaptatus]|uniref:LLM class flavin-dependent oxidoreductase n=1 Tax=unclassified Haladaptatus TaxID=2622732 RepID=UPI0023E88670|nr:MULTISPECIES: LLM class flavin-dependent oxidoreductase [unclassified Haladaptatus]
MQIGTGLFTCQHRPDDDRSRRDLYQELLTLGRAIEDAGLASAWVSEHHFTDDGYLSGTMPALGALAATTESIDIGTCIALAPLYDSVRLAEDAATVSLLSGGRLSLGMAVGYVDDEFDRFGVPKEERTARLEDAVRVLRGAWSEGPLDFEPEFHDAPADTLVTPKPESQPPILLGGKAKPAVRRAARIADGWIAPSSLSIDGVRVRQQDIHEIREKEGIDGEFTTYLIQHGFVADSKEEAWETMKDGYLYLQRKYAEWGSGESIPELPAARVEKLKAQAIFGTPADVIDQLEPYREALGDDVHFIFRTYYPGIGTDAMVECVERLGDEVVPHFA